MIRLDDMVGPSQIPARLNADIVSEAQPTFVTLADRAAFYIHY